MTRHRWLSPLMPLLTLLVLALTSTHKGNTTHRTDSRHHLPPSAVRSTTAAATSENGRRLTLHVQLAHEPAGWQAFSVDELPARLPSFHRPGTDPASWAV
jgi:hypothetical protein